MHSGDRLWGLGVTGQVWEYFIIVGKSNLGHQSVVLLSSNFKDLNYYMTSMNARGLRDSTKRRKVFNCMKKHTSSKGIIFMQATRSLKTCEYI